MDGKADWLIVGGGTAGCVLAARLSEAPGTRVLLVEAGRDFDQSGANDLTDTSGARAFMDPRYFWPDLSARLVAGPGGRTEPYKQAMLTGGGSSINGQIALRGAPDDYDHWAAAGAAGWGWSDVLPYFRRLETDLDVRDDLHGTEGPIRIRRTPAEDWDSVSTAMSAVWSRLGWPRLADLNGVFADGHGSLPVSNDGAFRGSTARQYLTPEVRSRPNLVVLPETRVLRVRLENGRAVGVDAMRDGGSVRLDAERVVLSAGALRTPQLLMLSGIGDGASLASHGIPAISHRPGVGRNLQDHPNVVVSGCLASGAGKAFAERSVVTYLRYSSGVSGCEASDMVMSVRGRSMWHAVGARICGLLTYVALPHSRGTVALADGDPLAPPTVAFGGLADERDLRRLIEGARFSLRIMVEHLRPDLVAEVFPARLSRRIERLSRPTVANDRLARVGAALMDASPAARRLIVRHLVSNGEDLSAVLADEATAAGFVRDYMGTSWHPCGTCRMGAPTDPGAVVDPDGAVIGVPGLFACDASVMPRITRTNTNLPTIMIAEHMADRMLRRHQPSATGVIAGNDRPAPNAASVRD
jgi:5-(hydroxymethyl)furfural/furfural oxidase